MRMETREFARILIGVIYITILYWNHKNSIALKILVISEI